MCVSGLKNCIKGMLTAPTMWPLGISGGRGRRCGNCQYKDGVDIVLIIKAISSGMNRTTTKAPLKHHIWVTQLSGQLLGLGSGAVPLNLPAARLSITCKGWGGGGGGTELVSITRSK